ncbi:MAG: protoheme IX farnesyltransferase [Sulfolobales archaeon]
MHELTDLSNYSKEKNFFYIINDLFKVKQTLLLMYVGIFGYLIAAVTKIDILKLVLIMISQFLTIGGTTGFNMVLDADLDAIMMRTRNRVIPSNIISRGRASVVSGVTLLIGLLVSYLISPLYMFVALLGAAIDLVVYTLIMKRKTWLSVVFGGFAGGAPALGGYVAYTGAIDLVGVSLMLIVALWSSPHIWYISAYYLEDYKKANIPTIPVLYGLRATGLASTIMILLIYVVVVVLFISLSPKPWILLITSTLMTIAILNHTLRHYARSSVDSVELRKTFKFLSPYLAILFLAFYLDKLLFI